MAKLFFPGDVAFGEFHGPGEFEIPPEDACRLLNGFGGVTLAAGAESAPGIINVEGHWQLMDDPRPLEGSGPVLPPPPAAPASVPRPIGQEPSLK